MIINLNNLIYIFNFKNLNYIILSKYNIFDNKIILFILLILKIYILY